MPSLPREVLEDFVERWLEANRVAEAEGDWKGLADFYIDEIRDVALGLEMFGLDGWSYPYQKVIIDDKIGEVVGFWKQVATDSEGQQSTIYGIGGSWFRLDADGKIEWQRDFFDFGHVQKLYLKLMQEGKLSKGMQERIERSLAGEKLPGYYPLGEAPVPIW